MRTVFFPQFFFATNPTTWKVTRGGWPLDTSIVSKCFTAVTVSRRLPLSPFQECSRSHRFKNNTAVTASGIIPLSPLQECDGSHRFKNVTAVTASGMLLQSWFQECYRSRRYKNVTQATATGCVTAVTASRILPQSSLQEQQALFQAGYRSHRIKNVTAVTASRTLPLSSLQECYRCDRVKEGCCRCYLFYTCLLLRFL